MLGDPQSSESDINLSRFCTIFALSFYHDIILHCESESPKMSICDKDFTSSETKKNNPTGDSRQGLTSVIVVLSL